MTEIETKPKRVKVAVVHEPKYRALRGLSLDGPVYGKKKWRFEVGTLHDLEMIPAHTIRLLLDCGTIEEVSHAEK